jgi:tetratricopeptide (TPR) repeat protein
MVDLNEFRDDDLVRRGRTALRSGRPRVANEFFSEYCNRRIRDAQPIAASLLADHALAIAYLGDLKEAAEICFRALARERRNADVFATLARVYFLSGSRRKAVDAIERGLALSPQHTRLLAFRDEFGVRRPRALPFLPRGNRWNVMLGRILDRLQSRRRTA